MTGSIKQDVLDDKQTYRRTHPHTHTQTRQDRQESVRAIIEIYQLSGREEHNQKGCNVQVENP